MSIAKRQKVLLDSGLLNKLGEAPFNDIVNDELTRALHRYGDELITALKNQLKADNTTASKDLLQSINYYTKQDSNSLNKFIIQAASHWRYVNDGRDAGKMPPIQSIIDWIANKGIRVRRSRAESSQSVRTRARSLAFAIAKNIAEKGTIKRFGYNGTGFLTNEVNDQTLRDLSIYLTEITGELVSLSFKANFKTI